MSIPLDQIANMPAFSPYYPMPPARYRNARFQFVYFRADVSAVDRVLPACFEPSDDGFCAAIGLSVPWSANYGAFEESVLVVRCRYEGREVYFAPVVFLNSRSSIPAGREIYGTPKVFAEMDVRMEERVMVTDTYLAGTSVMSVGSTMHREASADEMRTVLRKASPTLSDDTPGSAATVRWTMRLAYGLSGPISWVSPVVRARSASKTAVWRNSSSLLFR